MQASQLCSTAHAPLLEVLGLCKQRQHGDMRFVLKVPDFRLLPGQFIGLAGPSGCGKSTLLDLFALILRPDRCERFRLCTESSISVDLQSLWDSDAESRLAELRRTTLGYVLQTGGLLPFLTVADNIALPLRLLGRYKAATAIQELAESMGIAELLSRKPHTLSGGQRQRAAIARALIHRPQLVLADEPTAAVDRERAMEIIIDFKELAEINSSAIVLVTHDISLIQDVADNIYGFELRRISSRETQAVCHGDYG